MKNKKTKKGFTLVELLVVITILAVLATVSVIGYRNFTKKAQISNDTSLVAQLNLALKANEATDGKPENPTEVLEIMEENGFNVEKLTPTTSKYNIVWNQEANEFALLNEENGVVYGSATDDYRTWKFLDQYEADSNYSIYLKGSTLSEDLVVKAGLDAGNNTNIGKVEYNSGTSTTAKEVIIRTNGNTELEVNGYVDATDKTKGDVIKHFGNAGNLNIIKCAMASYHEFGNINGTVEISAGHIVVEENANVGTIQVANEAVANDVKITNNSESALVVKDEENKMSSDSSLGQNSIKLNDKDAVAIIGSSSYKNLKEALAAVNDGDTLKLVADYRISEDTADTVDERLIISKKITFDFGNYKIYGFTNMCNYNKNFTALIVDADCTFVAGENGGINADDVSNGGPYGVNIRKGAKLVVKSGTYLGGGTTIQVQEGELEILGGKFMAHPYDNPVYGYKYMINCIDAAFKDGRARINVKGGSFYKFDPSNSDSENPHSSFVPEGYSVNSLDGWYTVVAAN